MGLPSLRTMISILGMMPQNGRKPASNVGVSEGARHVQSDAASSSEAQPLDTTTAGTIIDS